MTTLATSFGFVPKAIATGAGAKKKSGGTGPVHGGDLLEARVTNPSGDTVLARILKLVCEAQAQKAPAQRCVD